MTQSRSMQSSAQSQAVDDDDELLLWEVEIYTHRK